MSDLMSREELRATFGVSDRTVSRWIADGRVSVRVDQSGKRAFPREQLQQWLRPTKRKAPPGCTGDASKTNSTPTRRAVT